MPNMTSMAGKAQQISVVAEVKSASVAGRTLGDFTSS